MAVCVFLMFAPMFLATSNAAPSEDGSPMIRIPAACKDQRFCSIKPEGYDELEERINNALPEFLMKDFDDRYGPETGVSKLSPKEDWHNCPYITKRESMYLYNHAGNDTKTDIFVQTKLFRQSVDVVTCASEHIKKVDNAECFQDLNLGAFGHQFSCVTTTARRTLYVFDIEKDKVIQKYFDVPACCTCRVTNL